MSKFSLGKSIAIDAPVSKVWRVFTDPTVTRQIGQEYVSTGKLVPPLGGRDWMGR